MSQCLPHDIKQLHAVHLFWIIDFSQSSSKVQQALRCLARLKCLVAAIQSEKKITNYLFA